MVLNSESAHAEDGTSNWAGAGVVSSEVAFWHLVAMQASARMMIRNLYLNMILKAALQFLTIMANITL